MIQFLRLLVGLILSNVYTRVLFLFVIPILIVFLIFLSINAEKGSFLYPVKTTFLTVIYPFQKAGAKVYTAYTDFKQYLKTKNKLIEENNILKQELDFLRLKIIELKNKEIENQQLKKLLNFTKENSEKLSGLEYITGKVIGISPDNLFNFVVIDIGENEGVKEGDLVITDGYLAGVINQVSKFSSSVLLTTNKNFKITVRLRNTREIAFFQGFDKNHGILKYVRPEQDIRVGDVVETAGLGKVPSGIPIGVVEEVSYNEGDFFKSVKVKVFLQPTKLEYILVLKEKENNED